MNYMERVNQLKNNRLVFTKLLSGINREDAVWKPDPDRWSVLEIICHMIDIEIVDFRYDLDLILFHPEDPWPHFDEMEWVTSRKYNQRDFDQMVEQFSLERKKTIKWLIELDDPDLTALHSGNEFKGEKKSAGDILISWLAHDFFHIRQLVLLSYDILNKTSEPYSSSYSGFYK